ncbi:MAG: NADH-quinone oxidoreductase subunit H [Nitrospinota bacterium]|nr:MAG: NADH-quinone oxidoreductase subunit H [Nitrospinota bacterium]
MILDVVLAVIKIGILIGGVLNLVLFLTWLERKQSAVMQDRIGANRAEIFGIRALGLFHPFADGLKMLTKEDFIPAGADRVLHTIAPFLSLFFALVSFATIPFGPTIEIGGRAIPLQVVDLNVGVLYTFAMLALGIYGIIIAGWASRNNYALLGGLRAAAQTLSYEILLGAAILGVAMVYQSWSLQEIVQKQGELLWGVIPKWGVVVQPVGFLLFLTAGIAATKRIPFDLPEGESEIIGYFVEYSGLKWGLFFMTDFVETVLVSGLLTTLFFGGWHIPYLTPDGFLFPGGTMLPLPYVVVVLAQIVAFGIKVLFFCWFLLLVRWTLPRFRYDQLMRLSWKALLPIACANITLTGLILLMIERA